MASNALSGCVTGIAKQATVVSGLIGILEAWGPTTMGRVLFVLDGSKVPKRGLQGPAAPVRLAGAQAGRVVDVIDLTTLQRIDTNPFQAGVQSIAAPGVFGVADYFRQ